MGKSGIHPLTHRRPRVPEDELSGLISVALYTIHHFFGSFSGLFDAVSDPRKQEKITYPLSSLAFVAIMMFLCQLGARRQIGLLLRNSPCQKTLQSLFGVPACPHGDTLHDAFSRLEPNEVQEVVSSATEILIRKKVLYPSRLLSRYYVVAIDGTGILTFARRHCSYCLTQTYNGKTIYYHSVLEAKIVTPNGFAFSLMTEFIENRDKKATKQDCELVAFYRLAQRLKKRFPCLPMLLTLDGLFANGPVFQICQEYGWKFMIVLKEDRLSSVNEELEGLSKLEQGNRLSDADEAKGTRQDLRWVNDVSYLDSRRVEHRLSVIECLETKQDRSTGKQEAKRFKWVTNCQLKQDNVCELANNGGRIRWKVENEGFNTQKNGGYGLEHAYTHNPTSTKVFYLLLQLAHIMQQLIQKGSLLKQFFPHGFGSAKNLAFRLLEAWRNAPLSRTAIDTILQWRVQIRFSADTS
jgi:hypothetical protein